MSREGIEIIKAYDPMDMYHEAFDSQEFACGDTKTCKVCGDEKPLIEFYHEKKGLQGRKAICKTCMHKKGNITREDILNAVADKLIIKMGL